MDNKREKKKTVSVDEATAVNIEKLARASGKTKKEFLSIAMQYFIKNGIDPSQHEPPKSELEKITKRIDQVVAFMRVQERDILKPLFSSVVATEERINEKIEAVSTQKEVNSLADKILLLRKEENERFLIEKNSFTERENKLTTGINTIYKKIDENKNEIISSLRERGFLEKISGK